MSKPSIQLTVANFTYEKTPGDKSNRQVLVISKPDDTLFGIEIKDNDLSPVQKMIDYIIERTEMDAKLREKHGIKDADLLYKRFKKDKIGNMYEANITVK